MARPEAKTVATAQSVDEFLDKLQDARRHEEALAIDAICRRVSGLEPLMWGPSIIGYGSYHYRHESGREGTMCRIGFSPRKAAHVLYAMGGPVETDEGSKLLRLLGKHTTGKGCLYIKKLGDVDLTVLEQLVGLSWQIMNENHPA